MVFGYLYHKIYYYSFLTHYITFLASFLLYYLLERGRDFTEAFPLRNTYKPTPRLSLLLGERLDVVSGYL
jgi:hypothetical protein